MVMCEHIISELQKMVKLIVEQLVRHYSISDARNW